MYVRQLEKEKIAALKESIKKQREHLNAVEKQMYVWELRYSKCSNL